MRAAAHNYRRLMRSLVLFGVVIYLLAAVPALAAEDAAEKAAELEQLQKRIKLLQTDLQSNQKKKSRAEEQLEAVEREINTSSREIARLDSELADTQAQLQQLQEQRKSVTEALSLQAGRLADEARAAYAMGRQQQVKLLLNQENPDAMGRMLTYFTYLSRARTEHISNMRATLGQLHELEVDIELKSQNLVDLRGIQKIYFADIQTQKTRRKLLLTTLTSQLVVQGNKLGILQDDEKQLQSLVYSLRELLSDIPADANQHRPFKSLKGKLRWPAKGYLSKRFGNRRGSSGLTWKGVLISAPEGGQVKAVSQGRVAFADWLRGFGLLLIIDHGDGYMSLYGQNQALYKEVGEWVDSEEVVATLGASGGKTEAGLYFELRHRGRPINPVSWCAGKPQQAMVSSALFG